MNKNNDLYQFKAYTNGIQVANRIARLERAAPYLRSGANVFTKGNFSTPSLKATLDSGQINPVNGVAGKGNIAPNVIAGTLGFAATSNSITIYWDGSNGSVPIVVSRADGTRFSVPAGQQFVGGLSPNVRYGFSVAWRVNNSTSLTFGPGNAGSPQIALTPSATNATLQAALQTQQGYDAEALYGGLIYFQTPAAGNTSGAGTDSSGNIVKAVRVRGFAATT